jgi:hypothetical protein
MITDATAADHRRTRRTHSRQASALELSNGTLPNSAGDQADDADLTPKQKPFQAEEPASTAGG